MNVVPFCQCMHKPDYEGGKPMGKDDDGTVNWRDGEYDVLSTEEVYAAVAGHRRVCRLQPDLLSA